jgi:hypothetical protein
LLAGGLEADLIVDGFALGVSDKKQGVVLLLRHGDPRFRKMGGAMW